MNPVSPTIVIEAAIFCLSCVGLVGWMYWRDFRAMRAYEKRQEILRNPPKVLRNRIKELEVQCRAFATENTDQRIEIRKLNEEIQLLNRRNKLITNELRCDHAALTIPIDRFPIPGRWAVPKS